jgi:hypothetical protein
MNRQILVVVLLLVASLAVPARAFAQRTLWGVTVSFSPVSETFESSRYLNDADELSLQGQTFRAGFSRGGALLSDWSLLFVQHAFKSGGVIDMGTRYTTNDSTKLIGFEAEKFAVKKNIKDRVLLGVVIAAGVAYVQGTLTAADGSTVEAKDVFTFLGNGTPLQPLLRLEFGVGIVAARGFRVRASSGFDWPGYSVSIAGTYFFGDR